MVIIPSLETRLWTAAQIHALSSCISLIYNVLVAQSCLTLCNSMDCIAHQAPLSMELSRQQYWSTYPFPSLEDLPKPGIEPMSPSPQADSLPSHGTTKPTHCKYWNLYTLEPMTQLECPHATTTEACATQLRVCVPHWNDTAWCNKNPACHNWLQQVK